MIQMPGKNEFSGRFDFHKWSAPIYETPQEVIDAFCNAQLEHKKLKSVSAIGAVLNRWDFEWRKDDLFPCEVCFCEPLQLIFTDGTTLEFLPMNNGGARIGINTIPTGLKNGINTSDCDVQMFLGEEIRGSAPSNNPFAIICDCKERYDVHMRYDEDEDGIFLLPEDGSYSSSSKSVKKAFYYLFNFENGYSLSVFSDPQAICHSLQYKVSLQKNGKTIYIPRSRVEASVKDIYQLLIVPGHGMNGWMQIRPYYRFDSGETDVWKGKSSRYAYGFSLSVDMDVCRVFLSIFLYKYFEVDDQERKRYDYYGEPEFDWYGVNHYSIKSTRKMIESVRKVANLLETDYDNEELDTVKKYFSARLFGKNADGMEAEEFIRNRIFVAIDFYRRFADHMEIMTDEAERDGCNYIEIYGP